MSAKEVPLFYCYSWANVPDSMIPNIFAEFKDNGVRHLVFGHTWAERILKEPRFFCQLKVMAMKAGIQLGAIHAPFGPEFDLNCPEAARRPGLIQDHITSMKYAAEVGCRTYTIHVGAYHWVFLHTPMAELRELALDAIEKLLPEAEKLDIVIAVENSFEPPNSAAEVVGLVSQFVSPYLGCCFDTGHACMMSPFPGKDPAQYFPGITNAWWQGIEETPNSLEMMAPYIVTTHMHDNDGYRDAHAMPGTGRIDWPEQIRQLKACPRLMSMQTETSTANGISVKRLVETFQRLV